MTILFFILLGLAIVVMGVALVQVIRLRSLAAGGRIGRVVRLLLVFIVSFFIAYVTAPFLVCLDTELTILLTAMVFLLGAVFVVIVLGVLRSLIQQVYKELDL